MVPIISSIVTVTIWLPVGSSLALVPSTLLGDPPPTPDPIIPKSRHIPPILIPHLLILILYAHTTIVIPINIGISINIIVSRIVVVIFGMGSCWLISALPAREGETTVVVIIRLCVHFCDVNCQIIIKFLLYAIRNIISYHHHYAKCKVYRKRIRKCQS